MHFKAPKNAHPSLTTRPCKSGSHCQNAILEGWLFSTVAKQFRCAVIPQLRAFEKVVGAALKSRVRFCSSTSLKIRIRTTMLWKLLGLAIQRVSRRGLTKYAASSLYPPAKFFAFSFN